MDGARAFFFVLVTIFDESERQFYSRKGLLAFQQEVLEGVDFCVFDSEGIGSNIGRRQGVSPWLEQALARRPPAGEAKSV